MSFGFQTVYNTSPFSLASMAAATMYLWFRSYAADKYVNVVVFSGPVSFIAACHYRRIFNSWVEGQTRGLDHHYRANVDWLFIAPLLLLEI